MKDEEKPSLKWTTMKSGPARQAAKDADAKARGIDDTPKLLPILNTRGPKKIEFGEAGVRVNRLFYSFKIHGKDLARILACSACPPLPPACAVTQSNNTAVVTFNGASVSFDLNGDLFWTQATYKQLLKRSEQKEQE